jgi:hypothetical protein
MIKFKTFFAVVATCLVANAQSIKLNQAAYDSFEFVGNNGQTYTQAGLIEDGVCTITITDKTDDSWTSFKLAANGSFSMSLSGPPMRQFYMDEKSRLSLPWEESTPEQRQADAVLRAIMIKNRKAATEGCNALARPNELPRFSSASTAHYS